MEKSQTLFDYLYHTIVTQIVTGELAYGDTLPSMRNLCTIYRVGIRTVRDVMQKLKEDGYVASQVRVGYQVVYQQKVDEEKISLLLSKWDAIMDVVKLMVYIFPDLLQDAASSAGPHDIAAWKAALNHKSVSAKETIRQVVHICGNILSGYRNEYLDDLFLELNRFLEVPAIPGVNDPNSAIAQSLSASANKILDNMEAQAYLPIAYLVKSMYSDIGFILNQFYEELIVLYPDHTDYSSTQFLWSIQRGREHRYLTITRDLIQALSDQKYSPGAFIPSIFRLSEQYNASGHTINQALSVLHNTGLITCQNNQGNRSTPGNAKPVPPGNCHPAIAQELHQYVCSLHLLALLCPSVSTLFTEYFSPETWNRDHFELTYRQEFPHTLMAFIAAHQPIKTLEQICSQLQKGLCWEYYVSTAWQPRWVTPRKAAELFDLLWANEREKFSSILQATYARLFLMVQDILTDSGCITADYKIFDHQNI